MVFFFGLGFSICVCLIFGFGTDVPVYLCFQEVLSGSEASPYLSLELGNMSLSKVLTINTTKNRYEFTK